MVFYQETMNHVSEVLFTPEGAKCYFERTEEEDGVVLRKSEMNEFPFPQIRSQVHMHFPFNHFTEVFPNPRLDMNVIEDPWFSICSGDILGDQANMTRPGVGRSRSPWCPCCSGGVSILVHSAPHNPGNSRPQCAGLANYNSLIRPLTLPFVRSTEIAHRAGVLAHRDH
ncbi:hypothetical protein BDN72DRAFT_432403 [Pluteus cervinus]|uniref:Uncharacterized protein n=1 Tax=Pluteus cervinus TaxID=181527 RepID=A0ACD3B0K0_9AGAR|nr:hypothetical protein BDN72DRAFT_432403 [Pluteus cervinus]